MNVVSCERQSNGTFRPSQGHQNVLPNPLYNWPGAKVGPDSLPMPRAQYLGNGSCLKCNQVGNRKTSCDRSSAGGPSGMSTHESNL